MQLVVDGGEMGKGTTKREIKKWSASNVPTDGSVHASNRVLQLAKMLNIVYQQGHMFSKGKVKKETPVPNFKSFSR